MEYRNSFSFIVSYELRKLFPYVAEINDTVMIFLRFPPTSVKSLRQQQRIYFQSSYRRKLENKKRKFQGDYF